jgi:glycosyltransferase involved in cell wall biosynthesis
VFITTPWYEPFGITPLEAMACGTPVIGANVGGIKFSVKEGITGGLVPPKQPKKLAQKVLEMVNDHEKLSQMSRNAIKHVNAWFTWEKVAEQMNELYRRVLNRERKQVGKLINIGRDDRAA